MRKQEGPDWVIITLIAGYWAFMIAELIWGK